VDRTFSSRLPIDLRLSLRGIAAGWGDRAVRLEEAEAWMATRTPDGPATVRLSGGENSVAAEAWGPGAAWALEHAPGAVGAEDDLTGFAPTHPLVRRLHLRYPGLRITRTARVFEATLRTVTAQRVSGTEAKRCYAAMALALGDPAPGPGGLLLPPDPDRLGRLAYHRFHPFGIERQRAERIIGVARAAGRLEETVTMTPTEARRRLTAVPGVGPWTAAKVSLVALGDPDAVPLGDYNIPNIVTWALAGEPRGDDARMLELLAPFAGHRGRVIALIKTAGIKAPAYGARAPTRAIERI
jgi:3-methyladenine DNA glycosylase/8-oxoguanine DNA glycosylase